LNREINDVVALPEPGSHIVFSPEGQHLAYSTFDHIWVIDMQTKVGRVVVDQHSEYPNVLVENPTFSHDGKWLLFGLTWDDTDEFDLATVDIDGSNMVRLHIKGLNSRPEFSPDGTQILSICEGDGVVGFEICIMNSDGRDRKHLTNVEGYHWAWFTPSGERIVFSRLQTRLFREDLAGLFVMNINGTDVTLLIDWYTSVLTFSADGEEVVFCKIPEEGGCEGIYVINLDGTNLRHLAYFDEEFLSQWY
jgi:Tol biopolymer transport system component